MEQNGFKTSRISMAAIMCILALGILKGIIDATKD